MSGLVFLAVLQFLYEQERKLVIFHTGYYACLVIHIYVYFTKSFCNNGDIVFNLWSVSQSYVIIVLSKTGLNWFQAVKENLHYTPSKPTCNLHSR